MDRSEDGRDVIDRRPVALENVQADAAVVVHVRMEELRNKFNNRRLIRIVLGELQGELESATFPGSVVGSVEVRRMGKVSFVSICMGDVMGMHD